MSRHVVPVATYRLQLTPEFGFAAAITALDHIARLGASHVYLSPIFEARRGSMHGYDGTDPRRFRAALGGRRGFRALVRAVRKRGLGIVLDIVPNHLAASPQGAPFRDVLLRGASSRFAHWFDIDWERLAPDGSRAIVLPRLERSLDQAIERGEVVLDLETRKIVHGDDRFPLRGGALDPAAQHYRLVPWREGMAALNYSRYADIADLIRLRVENERVFHETHALVAELIENDAIDGLRIDHLDGLLDAPRYLERLRRLVPRARRSAFWIIAEATAERVPGTPTTGYDFLSAATRALANHSDVRDFDRSADWRESPARARRACLERARELFGPEIASRRYPDRTARYIAAKAIEDTLLFRDGRTLALNELGHDPHTARRALGPRALVALLESSRSPRSLNATSTHDTKRGEDVRARLLALTARSREFAALVDAIEQAGDWPQALGRSELWYALQTLLAAWPNERESSDSFGVRITQHLEKAAREAKQHSSWLAPDRAYESAWGEATCRLLGNTNAAWRAAFDSLCAETSREGARLALTQLALKCFLPGVPDFYQGCESTALLLTDPDNRRPIEFARLGTDAAPKARATQCWLELRSRLARALMRNAVEWLPVRGSGHERAIAFVRGPIVVVALCASGPREGLRVYLPRGRYQDALRDRTVVGGRSVLLHELIEPLGVVVLERVGRSFGRGTKRPAASR